MSNQDYLQMVKVFVHTDTRYPVNRKIIRRAVIDTFKKNEIENIDAEVSVAVVGRRKMKELANKFFGDSACHEVLSFPFEDVSNTSISGRLPAGRQGFINLPDGILRFGDVVLSWPEVLLAAGRDNVMVDEELYLLTSHGVEHLLGEHHE